MITLQKAYQIIAQAVQNISLQKEAIKVQDGLGRVTATVLKSKLDLPPFDKAAMDGYAILANDPATSFEILETVAAGQAPIRKLEPGQTIKVMTGCPVPAKAARIIPVENTETHSGSTQVLEQSNRCHICKKGEDVKKGATIAESGSVLTPVLIANLISAGIEKTTVFKKPRVTIISTGDELVADYKELQTGKILDSNGPLLSALCQQNKYKVNNLLHAPDRLEEIVKVLKRALLRTDIVLLSGGVSVGDFDFVAQALQKLNFTIHFNRVAIKPGKPNTFATKKDKIVFALPGNPVAVFLAFQLFVRRAVKIMQNSPMESGNITLKLTADFSRKDSDRLSFIPAKLQTDGTVLPVRYNGSAHLLGLMEADGFFIIPAGIDQLRAGAQVQFVLKS